MGRAAGDGGRLTTAVPRRAGAPLMLLALAAAIETAAYWPGIMTWDATREYAQALSGRIDDWHPPSMIWLWRRLREVAPGPAPMLLIQLGLIFGGWGLLARWAWMRQRRGLAVGLGLCSLFPIALAIEGAVLKDCLMAGLVLVAAALLAPPDEARGWPARLGAAALLIAAATLRFNAFLACLPWLVEAVPGRWRAANPRRVAATVACGLVLIAAMPIANHLIGASRSGVELSEVMFDLGGIGYESGVDVFPPLPVSDPVAVNRRCYDPALWDPYSWWVADPCPIGFAMVRASLAASGRNAYSVWLRAILHHPFAYAAHRLRHFNRNSRFLVADRPTRLVPDQPDLNPWGYAPPADPARHAIDRIAAAMASTPLGWPIWWLALAAGVLILPCGGFARLAAGSAMLYGGGYLVFSVASDPRYHLWTMMAALLALATAADDLSIRPPAARLWALAGMPLTTVTLLGILARLRPDIFGL